MNAPARTLLTAGLCVLTAWTGYALSVRPRLAPTATPGAAANPRPDPAPILPANASQEEIARFRQLAMNRVVARCETAALWQWLAGLNPDNPGPFTNAVLDELLDRLGVAAIGTALDLPGLDQRRRLSDWLLMHYANRDPWAAFQIYQDHRSDFGGKWGADAAMSAIGASCAISGEKTVETMKAATQDEPVYLFNPEYPPGFDFRTVLDYLVDAPALPQGMPENLRSAWATQDPAAAAEWLAHHPPLKDDPEGTNPYNSYSDGRVIAAVAASDSPGRAEALASLATLPAERLDEAWKSITNREAALDLQLLEAATATGRRDSYLIGSLLNTRNTEILPPSWSNLPEEDRTPLIDRVLSQWEKDNSSPVAVKARDHWRASIEKQWTSRGK